MLFAAIVRLSVGLFVWSCIGLSVGWVAGSLLREDRNVLGDLVAGLVGGLGAGLLMGLMMSGQEALTVCTTAATVGAVGAVAVYRVLTRPRVA